MEGLLVALLAGVHGQSPCCPTKVVAGGPDPSLAGRYALLQVTGREGRREEECLDGCVYAREGEEYCFVATPEAYTVQCQAETPGYSRPSTLLLTPTALNVMVQTSGNMDITAEGAVVKPSSTVKVASTTTVTTIHTGISETKATSRSSETTTTGTQVVPSSHIFTLTKKADVTQFKVTTPRESMSNTKTEGSVVTTIYDRATESRPSDWMYVSTSAETVADNAIAPETAPQSQAETADPTSSEQGITVNTVTKVTKYSFIASTSDSPIFITATTKAPAKSTASASFNIAQETNEQINTLQDLIDSEDSSQSLKDELSKLLSILSGLSGVLRNSDENSVKNKNIRYV